MNVISFSLDHLLHEQTRMSTNLDKTKIIDPRVRIKLNLNPSENHRIIPSSTETETAGCTMSIPSKQSSKRLEREIKSVQEAVFNPLEAISRVLVDAKQSQRLNNHVTSKV